MRVSSAAAVLLLMACQRARLADRFQNADSMRTAVLALVPVGSGVDSGRVRLEREGFTCSLRHGQFGGHAASAFLWCDASVSAGSPVSRRWQVALFTDSGLVRDVDAKTGLVGP